jgi:hypothetical protein
MDERPKARRTGLLIEAVDDEVLVYDTERHRAHALNRSAADVWERCDGVATPAEIAARLSDVRGVPVTEEFVRYGLEQLREFHLLEEPATRGPSRRELIQVGGLAAVALPVIASIVAPIAAEAQSGLPGPTGPTGATGATG